MPKPLTRRQLDNMGCGEPNCSHDHSKLVFHGKCHMGSPTWATYEKVTGIVTITCMTCKSEIARIKVAA